MGINFRNFVFIQLHFVPLNNIIDSLKSIIIVTKIFTTFYKLLRYQILIGLHLDPPLTLFFYLPITTHHISNYGQSL